jgi:hypothetical protein
VAGGGTAGAVAGEGQKEVVEEEEEEFDPEAACNVQYSPSRDADGACVGLCVWTWSGPGL